MTIKLKLNSCSLTTLHTNIKHHINGPFVITQCFTNGTVNLQYGATQIKHNIRRMKPYNRIIKLEILVLKYV